MVLMSAVSLYQLLVCILYRLLYLKDIEVTLLIASSLSYKADIDKLTAVFDNIKIYDFGRGNSKMGFSYFDSFLKEENISIPDFDDVFVGCAHSGFGRYIASLGVDFIFLEDGCGALSRPYVLEATIKDENVLAYIGENGLLTGQNPHIKRIIYNPVNQLYDIQGSKYEPFEVTDSFTKLNKSDQDMVLTLFGISNQYDIPSDSVLILTEHFANLRLMTWEEQTMVYQLVCDYFLGGKNLVFKPHPDDWMYYGMLFPQSTVIRDRFPAELLPPVFTNRPKTALTLSSSSIYSLRPYFDECIEFDHSFSYDRRFHILHRYFAALSVAEQISCDNAKLIVLGANVPTVRNLIHVYSSKWSDCVQIERLDDLKEYGEPAVVIVDQVENPALDSFAICKQLMELSEDTLVFFINMDREYSFFHPDIKEVWRYIYPIEIKKSRIDTAFESYHDLEAEQIFLFRKKGFPKMDSIHKDLEYCGIAIDVDCFDEKENRIRALAGILEATEKRLLFYIDKCDKLQNEIMEAKL